MGPLPILAGTGSSGCRGQACQVRSSLTLPLRMPLRTEATHAPGSGTMKLLDLPTLRGFEVSAAAAWRLHELLQSRYKVEVRVQWQARVLTPASASWRPVSLAWFV